MMSETEAVEIASKFAEQQGYATEHYSVKAAQQGAEWQISFQRTRAMQKPSPGDFFTVYVDDCTGTVARIVYGK
jgi:hypothetical protein